MNPDHKYSLMPIDTPANLAGSILECIKNKMRQRARVNFGFLLGLSSISLLSAVYFFINLWRGITKTGFYDYLSLVLSDTSAIGAFWKQLLVSLAESLPVFGFAVFIAAAGVFIWSTAKTFRSASILKII